MNYIQPVDAESSPSGEDRTGDLGGTMNRTRLLLALVIAGGSVALASCAPSTPGTGFAAAGCYDSPTAGAPDFRFDGVANSVNNMTAALDLASFTLSSNGTCAGVPLTAPYAFTLVQAAGETAATVACTSLGLSAGAGQLQLDYPSFPVDAWVCNPPEADPAA